MLWYIMTTINVSGGAYNRILTRKQEIEKRVQGVVSISLAVDDLLGVAIVEVADKR